MPAMAEKRRVPDHIWARRKVRKLLRELARKVAMGVLL